MPYSYTIDRARGLVHVKAEGRLTPQGVHDCIEAYLNDSAFEASFDVLLEYDDTVELNALPEHPVRFTEQYTKGLPDIVGRTGRLMREGRPEHPPQKEYRAAVAGGSKRLRTTFVAAMGLMVPGVETASFATVEEAMSWLGH